MLRLVATRLALLFLSFFVAHAASAQPGNGYTILGTWSWQSPGPAYSGGVDNNTILFQNDGTYVVASQAPDGKRLRYWGQYTVAPLAQNQYQYQIQTQIQGWLPQQVCTQAPGFPMYCVSLPRPNGMSIPFSFTSPSTLISSEGTWTRDPQAFLLQQNVPQQMLNLIPSPIQPPAPSPYGGGGGGHTNIPGLGGNCDDLQQQRICSINGGHIITSGGCMKCISP